MNDIRPLAHALNRCNVTDQLGRRREALKHTRELAKRLCIEIQALTGNANSGVLLEVLMRRIRVGPAEMERVLAFAAEQGWVSRTIETATLCEPGRQEALRHWPPAEVAPLRQARRKR